MARRPCCSLLLLLCLSLLSSTRADDKPCTGHNAGKYYDLNRLQTGKDYELKTPGGNELVLAACKSVSHETWKLKVPDPGLVAGFVRRGHGDFSLGQSNTTLTFSGRAAHPHLTFSRGSKCVDADNKETALQGSTEIEFVCDTAAGAGAPRLVAQLPPGDEDAACAWVFEWRTAAACPTSEGTTFGGVVWFLFVSLLILLALYLSIGTAYNVFVLHLAGADALPRFTLAGMLYHGREALEMAGDWWAARRNGSSGGGGRAPFSRGPVGLGGPGGFRRANADAERAPFAAPSDDENAYEGAHGNGVSGNGNTFVRTGTSVRKEQMHPQTNPASHQTQVMGGAPHAMPQPQPQPLVGGMGTGGLNPASHQAQLMAGMPVPHLSAPRSSSPSSQTQTQNAQQNYAAPTQVQNYAAPTPTRQTFSVGDDEGDEDAPEIDVADVRGRGGGGGGGGDVRL